MRVWAEPAASVGNTGGAVQAPTVAVPVLGVLTAWMLTFEASAPPVLLTVAATVRESPALSTVPPPTLETAALSRLERRGWITPLLKIWVSAYVKLTPPV